MMRRGIAAAVLAIVLVGLAPSARADVLRQGDEAGTARLDLVSQNLWVAPNGRLEATVHLDQQAPSGSEIAVVVYQRLRSRSLFQASLDGELGSSLATISRPVGDLPRDQRGDIVVAVPLSESNEPGRTRLRVDGVYPVRIELRNEDGDEIDGFTTHLVRTTAEAQGSRPLAVALLVPLTADPSLAPDGSSQMLDEDRGALSTLIAAIAGHPTVPLTVVPSPETLTALETSTTTGDRQLVDMLRGAIGAREVLAGPYVDVDPAAMLRDGLDAELTTQLRMGSDTLASTLSPARPDGRTWIADDPLDSRGLQGLRDAGVDQLVLREDLLTPADLPFTLTRPALLESGGVTVQSATFIDGGLVRHFDEHGDPVLAATHLLADLSQLYFDSPSVQRGAVVAPPDDWQPSAVFLDTFLSGIAASPLLTPVTIDDYFRTVPRAVDDAGHPVVRSLAEPSTASLGTFGPALVRTRQRLTGFATMIDEGDPLLASAERRLLVASSTSLSSDRRSAYLDAVDAEINQRDVVPARAGTPVGDAHLSRRPSAAHDPQHSTDAPPRARPRDESQARLPRRTLSGRDARRRQHDGDVQGPRPSVGHVPPRRPSDITRRHASHRDRTPHGAVDRGVGSRRRSLDRGGRLPRGMVDPPPAQRATAEAPQDETPPSLHAGACTLSDGGPKRRRVGSLQSAHRDRGRRPRARECRSGGRPSRDGSASAPALRPHPRALPSRHRL